MSSLEINVDTRDFDHLQATLARIDPKDLDKILRDTVNVVGVRTDNFIRTRVSAALGVPEPLITHRLILNKSNASPHVVRSSWLWYGKKKLSGTRLAMTMGAVFTPGQVQVGKYLWRNGFWGPQHSKISGVLMQRVAGAGRYPIKAAMVDTDQAVQSAIDAITPLIPRHLESVLTSKVEAYLAKL